MSLFQTGSTSESSLPDDLLGALARAAGVRSAVLLDRSGRILAQEGVLDREALTQVASLVAGLHATGSRLMEAAGDRSTGGLQLELGALTASLIPLPLSGEGRSLLLFLVRESAAPGSLQREVEEMVRAADAHLSGGTEVEQAEAFEASLMESLERAFPSDPSEEPQ